MRTLLLTANVTTTLDINGNGTVTTGPKLAGEIWYPASVSVSSGGTPASNVNTTTGATANIYTGVGVGQSSFVDGTYNVQGDSSSMISGQALYPGQNITVVWAGANASVQATAVIQGTRQVP